MIREVFTLTKSETRSIKRNIFLNKNLVGNNEQFFITSNPTWLNQILLNLVLNSTQALKDSKTNEPIIDIHIKQTKDSLVITLVDNGPGIPP